MVYKYLLVQINSSDLFLWVGFIYCVFLFCFFKKSFMTPFYGWDSTASRCRPMRGGTLLFTTKLPSILDFPENLLPSIFQFSRIDSKFWCDVLHDLVPFVQSKKREKHLWRSVTFGLLKVTLLHGCISRFQNCTDGAKLRKTSLSRLCVEHRWFEKGMGYAPP